MPNRPYIYIHATKFNSIKIIQLYARAHDDMKHRRVSLSTSLLLQIQLHRPSTSRPTTYFNVACSSNWWASLPTPNTSQSTHSLSTSSLMFFHLCSLSIHCMAKQMMQEASTDFFINVPPCSKYSDVKHSFIKYFILNSLLPMLHNDPLYVRANYSISIYQLIY